MHYSEPPVPYRPRSHSVMAAISFLKRQHSVEDEDLPSRAARYRAEYLANREKQKFQDLKEMDEFESKLLDKAISHLINIENQCQQTKKQRTYRVPHNSICEENSFSKLNLKFGSLGRSESPDNSHLESPIRKRFRNLASRVRKLFQCSN